MHQTCSFVTVIYSQVFSMWMYRWLEFFRCKVIIVVIVIVVLVNIIVIVVLVLVHIIVISVFATTDITSMRHFTFRIPSISLTGLFSFFFFVLLLHHENFFSLDSRTCLNSIRVIIYSIQVVSLFEVFVSFLFQFFGFCKRVDIELFTVMVMVIAMVMLIYCCMFLVVILRVRINAGGRRDNCNASSKFVNDICCIFSPVVGNGVKVESFRGGTICFGRHGVNCFCL
mmetsp:Transcript_9637/g.18086  ORF Transcript_9637/g.18086 Transcript_9637/m.18086 type:complete len:227 (+) Transcript_9637:437-1117(+)